MSRQQRFNLADIPQHVQQRGNNRGVCFFNDEDYRFYLASLYDAAELYECAIHAYALMAGHVHLLLTPRQPQSVSRCMQSIGSRYVQYINHKYRRSGTLWEGRYRACLVDSGQYLLTCSRYIEFCSVCTGMAGSAEDYPWSSYRANALGEENTMITHHAAYRALAETDRQRAENYHRFCANGSGKELFPELKQALKTETLFGSEQFKREVEGMLNRKIRVRGRGRPRKKRVGENLWEVV